SPIGKVNPDIPENMVIANIDDLDILGRHSSANNTTCKTGKINPKFKILPNISLLSLPTGNNSIKAVINRQELNDKYLEKILNVSTTNKDKNRLDRIKYTKGKYRMFPLKKNSIMIKPIL
ncbi:hypothetical protein NTE06_004271, partial [Vibrio fluvialis]|nr:hypothetical protein [Vibrio fluvialis]